jgi:hypothetical protein
LSRIRDGKKRNFRTIEDKAQKSGEEIVIGIALALVLVEIHSLALLECIASGIRPAEHIRVLEATKLVRIS